MAVQVRCPGYGPGDGYERHLFTANGELRSTVCLRCGARGQVMSKAAARPWTSVKSASERGYKVRGGKHNQIIIARYLSEEDAALIVKAVNAYDASVRSLDEVMGQVGGFLPRQMERDALAVLEEAEG